MRVHCKMSMRKTAAERLKAVECELGNANSPPKLGGVDASSRKRCGATLLRADGVVPAHRTITSASRKFIRWLRIFQNHPVCAQFWETLMRAATPPNLGGEFRGSPWLHFKTRTPIEPGL